VQAVWWLETFVLQVQSYCGWLATNLDQIANLLCA